MRVAYVLHRIHVGSLPDDLAAWWAPPVRIAEALAHAGVEVDVIVGTDGLDATRVQHDVHYRFVADSTRTNRLVAAAVRRISPDVIHVNGITAAVSTMALRTAVGRHARIVVQHHGERPGTGRALAAQRAARRAVDAYCFTGAFTGQAVPFEAAGILAASTPRFEVLEASTDLVAPRLDEARAATGVVGDPAVVWVGRFTFGKAPIHAVHAAALARKHRPELHLYLLDTDGSLHRELVPILDNNPELAEGVQVVGPVPHREMAAWYGSCQVYLSTSHHEAAGFSLIEAFACGCTPVVTDLPPTRVITGSIGRRFRPGDVDTAGDALGTLRPLDRVLVRREFAERLGWDSVARQLLAAYRGKR